MSEDVEFLLDDAESSMKKAISHLETELTKITRRESNTHHARWH